MWYELDAKYANSVQVSGTLVNDFVNYICKVKSDKSKIVELKAQVLKLHTNLKTTTSSVLTPGCSIK